MNARFEFTYDPFGFICSFFLALKSVKWDFRF